MDLEGRLFFPIARFVFVMAALLLLAGLLYAAQRALDAWAKTRQPVVATVNVASIQEKLKPFSSAAATDDPSKSPFSRASAPLDMLAAEFPGTAARQLAEAVQGTNPREESVAAIRAMLDDAVGLGDEVQRYCVDALTLHQNVAPQQRVPAQQFFHRDRMAQLRQIAAVRTANQVAYQFNAMLALSLGGAMLLTTLLLAVLSIERHNRQMATELRRMGAQASAVPQGEDVPGFSLPDSRKSTSSSRGSDAG